MSKPDTTILTDGRTLMFRTGFPDDWSGFSVATVTYSDGTTRQVAYPSDITALNFSCSIDLIEGLAAGPNAARMVGLEL